MVGVYTRQSAFNIPYTMVGQFPEVCRAIDLTQWYTYIFYARKPLDTFRYVYGVGDYTCVIQDDTVTFNLPESSVLREVLTSTI